MALVPVDTANEFKLMDVKRLCKSVAQLYPDGKIPLWLLNTNDLYSDKANLQDLRKLVAL